MFKAISLTSDSVFILKFFVFFLVFNLVVWNAQTQPKVSKSAPDSLPTDFIEVPIDKLLNLWYIGKMSTDTNISSLNKYGFKPDEIPSYSDSVYEKRLNDLQSPIPLTYNKIVKKYIELYTVKKREQVQTMLGLSKYYFPILEAELSKQGLPMELKYITIIESALNTHAVSKSGATGLWQFMYATARIYDLQITSYIDERRDPYRLTEKAVTYFNDLYHVFGDWLYVIASYNCGPGALNKAIVASGYKSKFWDVYPYLPEETRGYVPAFIAATYTMNYYIEHNLYPKNIYSPGLLDTIQVSKRLRFDVIANALQISTDILKELNPQYIKEVIPQSPSGTKYILRLPIEVASKFQLHRDRIYRYQYYLDQKEKEEQTSGQDYKKVNSFSGENTNSYSLLKYTVKSGDNMKLIADWYDCTESDILRWNGLASTALAAGKILQIYVPSQKVAKYKDINTLSFDKKQELIGKVKPEPVGEIVYYTVQEGDTLWAIARKFPGLTPYDIMELNQIDSESLVPGQKIKIKK